MKATFIGESTAKQVGNGVCDLSLFQRKYEQVTKTASSFCCLNLSYSSSYFLK
jgi:hypothetical protein